jgi:hypothetical protein
MLTYRGILPMGSISKKRENPIEKREDHEKFTMIFFVAST